jgi:hypothetical protein
MDYALKKALDWTFLVEHHQHHPPETQFGEGQPAIAWLGWVVRIV